MFQNIDDNKMQISKLSLIILLTFSSLTYSACNDLKAKIDNIKQYQMNHIIKRCQKDFGYSDKDMIILEQELKRYLTLVILRNEPFGMFSEDVDNLWHTFILFTKEYAEFGQNFAGKFLHHIPELDDTRSPEKLVEGRKQFSSFLQAYKETFGIEAHNIWFLDMCSKKP